MRADRLSIRRATDRPPQATLCEFRPRQRPAFTLIETIATLTVLTIVSLSIYQLFNRLNETMRVTTKHDLAVREAYRLAETFRKDVRRATAAELFDDQRGVRLVTGDGSAEYRLTVDGVTYTFDWQGDSEGPPRRDLFRYGVDASLRCRIDDELSLVVLPLAAGRDVSPSSGADFRRRPIEVTGVLP